MALRLAVIVGIGTALAVVGAAYAPAARQASPTLKIVGFATTLSDGKTAPRVQARDGGVITKCLQKRALSAIFVVGGLPAGSRYQQYWSANVKGVWKTVYTGEQTTLTSGIGAPRQVFMGFASKRALANGRYSFQFILDGRPHVLGSVTRKC
jgi:hypothetical protein